MNVCIYIHIGIHIYKCTHIYSVTLVLKTWDQDQHTKTTYWLIMHSIYDTKLEMFGIKRYIFLLKYLTYIVVSHYIIISSAIPSYRGSSQPRDGTHVSYVSCIGEWILNHWATWEVLSSRPVYSLGGTHLARIMPTSLISFNKVNLVQVLY